MAHGNSAGQSPVRTAPSPHPALPSLKRSGEVSPCSPPPGSWQRPLQVGDRWFSPLTWKNSPAGVERTPKPVFCSPRGFSTFLHAHLTLGPSSTVLDSLPQDVPGQVPQPQAKPCLLTQLRRPRHFLRPTVTRAPVGRACCPSCFSDPTPLPREGPGELPRAAPALHGHAVGQVLVHFQYSQSALLHSQPKGRDAAISLRTGLHCMGHAE